MKKNLLLLSIILLLTPINIEAKSNVSRGKLLVRNDKKIEEVEVEVEEEIIEETVMRVRSSSQKNITNEAKESSLPQIAKENSSPTQPIKDPKQEKGNGPVAPINLKNRGVRISSHYGHRKAPKKGASTFHRGIDIAAPRGTHIYSAFDGKVTFVQGANGSAGNTIRIKHENNMESTYMHMSKRSVRLGDVVKAGQIIGTVGTTGNSTGNHLHFEMKVNGKHVNPIQILGCNLGICR